MLYPVAKDGVPSFQLQLQLHLIWGGKKGKGRGGVKVCFNSNTCQFAYVFTTRIILRWYIDSFSLYVTV